MEKCLICGKEFNSFDPLAHPPTCSKDCWWLWITVVDHKGRPCWIKDCLEVSCGIHNSGYCQDCQVFKIEEEINKRGLNKGALIGNY